MLTFALICPNQPIIVSIISRQMPKMWKGA